MGSLATWRLAYSLVNEEGPWCILVKLRGRFGIVHGSDGSPIGHPDCSLLSCVWCCSVWVAVVLLFLPLIVSVVLAMSTVAIIINRLVEK